MDMREERHLSHAAAGARTATNCLRDRLSRYDLRLAISRVGRLVENFRRMISRAWRIETLSAGIDRSLGLPKERP